MIAHIRAPRNRTRDGRDTGTGMATVFFLLPPDESLGRALPSYEIVALVRGGSDLDATYEALQNGPSGRSWNMVATCRSMNVGDVVVTRRGAFRCMPVGWEAVADEREARDFVFRALFALRVESLDLVVDTGPFPLGDDDDLLS